MNVYKAIFMREKEGGTRIAWVKLQWHLLSLN